MSWLKQLFSRRRFYGELSLEIREHIDERIEEVVAELTVALGIGANTAMFSVVEGVLLSPLQYFQADRLVMVWENNPRFPRVWVSYPNFLDWQRSARSFQQMAAGMEQGVDLTAPGI